MNAAQWNQIKKHQDRAKKMLSTLHMSSAYLKVSWNDLSEDEQSKISKWVAKNGSGWFEKGEPVSTPTGIKNVAPRHRKVALKKKSTEVMRKPIKRERPVRTEGKVERKAKKEPQEKIGKDEIRSYKNYGMIWEDGKPHDGVVSIDYYKVIKNPPKDLSYSGVRDFHDDSASIYYSKSDKTKVYIVPRLTGEHLVHLRTEKLVPDKKKEPEFVEPEKELSEPKPEQVESALERAKKVGIDTEGLYVDISEGIRFRMMEGDLKGKTAFRCPECGRGTTFGATKPKLACAEHGSLTDPKFAFDLRKIGIDKEVTEWAEGEYASRLVDARMDGYKTVADFAAAEKDEHYKQYLMLGVGLEKIFSNKAQKINQEINDSFFTRTIQRIDEAEKEFDSTGKIDEWQLAWDTEYSKMYQSLPEAEQKQIDSRMYGLSNYIHEKKLADETRAQEEQKKKQFKFTRTTYATYLKAYPYAMSYFLNSIVRIPLNADPQSLTDEELDKINEVVADGYDIISDTGVYTEQWFKENDEREREEEAEARQEKEKQEKKKTKKTKPSYIKTVQKDGKTIQEPIKKPFPFTYKTIDFVSHKEKSGWYVTEATTGLKFADGGTQLVAESAAKEIIDKHGAVWTMERIKDAKQVLERELTR